LNVLIDEDSQSKILIRLLKDAGHSVLTVADLGANSKSDPEILKLAAENDRVLLTKNCADFAELHKSNLICHSGIIAIYQNANPKKSMSYDQIVAAIDNFEKSNTPVHGQFIDLNHYRLNKTPSPP
jgi:predicted nuclease of predicted toxin-antitoxin system